MCLGFPCAPNAEEPGSIPIQSKIANSGSDRYLSAMTNDAPARPLAVFAYDFDGTLAPGHMQNHAFIPDELGMDRAEFWAEVGALARAQRGDEILAYMHQMLAKARERGLELSLKSWRARGAS